MKRRKFSAEFKTKVVLEVLKGELTLNEIAAKYQVLPKSILDWKKKFLENAELAMEPNVLIKEYKKKIEELEKKNERYAKKIGELTVEKEWLEKKLRGLDLRAKQALLLQAIDSIDKKLSSNKKAKLLGISRSALYYTKRVNPQKELIKRRIVEIANDEYMCVYGEKKVHQELLQEGFKISLNTVAKYRKELGIKAIVAVKPLSTTISDDKHKKYPYRLKETIIDRPNKVWSADITYIKFKNKKLYLSAIIDWYSKAILAYNISNTLDTHFVMDIVNEALQKYPKPEIFNTDQGAQYTSLIHTQTLKEKGIAISMTSKGRATDNIAIERFFRTAKSERIYLREYDTIQELKDDIKNYIHFYNFYRYHQTLGYKRPMEVYDKELYLQTIQKEARDEDLTLKESKNNKVLSNVA